jgi:MATE family multidrug resistance protein
LINILVNYVLIFGKFGFPQLGIIGAAIGTLVSRIMMFFVLYLLLKKNKIIMNVTKGFFLINKKIFTDIISLGFPTSLQMLFEVGIFTSAIWLSGLLGEVTQSANQIVLNVSSFTFMVASGLGLSASIRAGNQKGLNNYYELKRISLSILLLGLIFALIFSLLIFYMREIIPFLFVDIDDVNNYQKNLIIISKSSRLFIIVALFQLFDSAQVIILGSLRGMQDVIIPTIIIFISYWFIGFPISYYFGSFDQFKEMGIWFGLLTGLLFTSVFLYLRFNQLVNQKIDND